MREQKLKVGKYYILTEYNGGSQYDDDINKLYKISSETENYYKIARFGNVGKSSLFMKAATFIEATVQTHPEYFL